MDFLEYQKSIEKFCIYPKMGYKGLQYPMLGFLDEMIEFKENPVPSELGDVFFYITIIMSHLGIDNYEITDDATYSNWMMINCNLVDLSIESYGEACGYLKKTIRDVSLEKLNLFISEIKETARYVFLMAYDIGSTPQEIMNLNYEKLSSRLSRGKIQGDGDNR